MGLILKAILAVVVVGFLGLVAYAYLADLSPDRTETHKPVSLNAAP